MKAARFHDSGILIVENAVFEVAKEAVRERESRTDVEAVGNSGWSGAGFVHRGQLATRGRDVVHGFGVVAGCGSLGGRGLRAGGGVLEIGVGRSEIGVRRW